ncbi:MAG: hypothetical protein ACEQSR_05785 [Candidatus Methylacidiphilales bacterium]
MNIKIRSDGSFIGTFLSFFIIGLFAYGLSESILITILALLLWYLVYYLEKNNGIAFTDNDITIIDGLFFKKKYVYKYENLTKFKIVSTLAPGLMGSTFDMYFDDDFKYSYYVSDSNYSDLKDVKDFLRERGIYVDDDSEPSVYGR